MPKPQQTGFPRLEYLEAEFDRLLAEEARQAAGHRRRNLFAFAGVSVATAMAAAALLTFVSPGGGGSLGVPSAQAALHQFADDAEDSGLTAGPGQLLYQRKLTDALRGFDFDPTSGELRATPDPESPPEKYISESWLNTKGDGTFSVREQSGKPVMTGEFGGAGAGALGGPLKLTYEEVLDLPRDPEELLRRIEGVEGQTSGGAVGTIANLLDTPLPPDLQSALLDAAALIPGAELVEGIKAPSGETLTAISYATGNDLDVRYELLFDPASGSYKGHSIVLADGQRFYGSLILQRGVVDAPGETPAQSTR